MGNVIIKGQSKDDAVLLLEAAQKLDLPAGVVRTVTGGFRVPVEVAEKAGLDYEDPNAEQAEVQDFPDGEPNKDWKVAELEAYAAANEIDLDGATRKDDILAAVTKGA